MLCGGFSNAGVWVIKSRETSKMRQFAGIIFPLLLMACCSSSLAYSSTSGVHTLIFNQSMTNSALPLYASNTSSLQGQDSIGVHTLDSLKLKDPAMAMFYAVIPGLVLHGSGHMYAGEVPTAIILFGGELIGVGVALMGGLSQIEGPHEKGENAVVIGSLLIWGTLIYDFTVSPMMVNRKNSKLLSQRKVDLELRKQGSQSRVVVVWRF